MALIDRRAKMPQDLAIVGPDGRILPAWQQFFANIETLMAALIGQGSIGTTQAAVLNGLSVVPAVAPSAETFPSVDFSDPSGTDNDLEIAELKADVNALAAATARVEAKVNAIIAAMQSTGLMET